MAWRTSIASVSSENSAAAASMTSRGRPVRGAGKLPGGEAEGQRGNAVARQQRVEHRRLAKHDRADDGRVEGDPAQHDDDGADRRASRAPDSARQRVASAGTAAAAPTSMVVHSAPNAMCSISTAATPAPASAKETASPPVSGGVSLRAIASPPADEDRDQNERGGGIDEDRDRDCRRRPTARKAPQAEPACPSRPRRPRGRCATAIVAPRAASSRDEEGSASTMPSRTQRR